MDSVHPGGLGGTFGGNPLSCAAALAVLDEVATPEFRARADAMAERLRTALDAIAAKVPAVGEVRGLGPMLALELVTDRETKTPDAELAKRTIELARERGLILLGCGMYGNVLRLLPPLIEADDEIDEGRDPGGCACRRKHRSFQGRRSAGRRGRRPPDRGPQDVRGRRRRRLDRPRDPARRVLHDARAVGLRQDDDAAPDRRLRAARLGPDLPRRRRRRREAAVRPRRQHRLPGLRAVSA